MRASILLALVCAGCHGVTALDVSLSFDDSAHHPGSLQVSIVVAGTTVKSGVPVTISGRTIRNGDDFVIALDDNLGSKSATVEITAIENNKPGITGQATRVVVEHAESPLQVTLGTNNFDGGVPQNTCTPGCANNVATSCPDGGMPITTPCPLGCNGDSCTSGDTCADPVVIDASGSFNGTFMGIGDGHSGSCGGMGGPDLVTRTTLTDWSTVTISTTGTAFPPVLYTADTTCTNGPATEIPLAGPCNGVADLNALACASGNGAKLVECGLPPGTYFTFLDSTMPTTGAYDLSVTIDRATLTDCNNAGNLLHTNTAYTVDISRTKDSFTSSGGCMDNGAGSNDAILFFNLTAKHNVTITTAAAGFVHSVYVRSGCSGSQLACTQAPNKSKGTSTALTNLDPGTYFVIVDGAGQITGGPVQLTLAIN
jgi:hypothetical protein